MQISKSKLQKRTEDTWKIGQQNSGKRSISGHFSNDQLIKISTCMRNGFANNYELRRHARHEILGPNAYQLKKVVKQTRHKNSKTFNHSRDNWHLRRRKNVEAYLFVLCLKFAKFELLLLLGWLSSIKLEMFQ